ncbi:hypothetical protein LXA11_17635, partial [Erwinia amylovora]|uniref:hypothetical protein n=1 Tax=Erwinia amylovora TaxID=552 RepID=UPI0020C12508
MKNVLITVLIMVGYKSSLQAAWPPETGSKEPGNALEYPTKLAAVDTSLEKLLNRGATVISSSIGQNGPVVTLHDKNRYLVCLLRGA